MLLTIETTDSRKFTHYIKSDGITDAKSLEERILYYIEANYKKCPTFVPISEDGVLFLYNANNIVRMYAAMEDG